MVFDNRAGTDRIRAMKDQVEHSHQRKLEPLTLSKFDPSKRTPKVYPKGIETEATSLQTYNDQENRNFSKSAQKAPRSFQIGK